EAVLRHDRPQVAGGPQTLRRAGGLTTRLPAAVPTGPRAMYTRNELHHLVLDVEFVLISVVQGVALTTLAVEAGPMLRTHDLMTYAFVGTGLLFILSFWSVALVHAISFLTWPMDLVHYFFYFAVALVECLTFTQMERPRDWFGYSIACFVL